VPSSDESTRLFDVGAEPCADNPDDVTAPDEAFDDVRDVGRR
jgi:hypothetical protein